MKLIYTLRKYKNKEGKEKIATDFYIDCENGTKLQRVQPTQYGDKGNNYVALKTIAIYVKDLKAYVK